MAMLGCGAVADLYMPAFKYLKNAKLVAAIDINDEMARDIAEKYNIEKIYTVPQEAANDPEIDAVIVGTPPNLHAEHIELFARNKKNILCEKPMASTVQDCQRIINVCKKNNVKLQLGFGRGANRYATRLPVNFAITADTLSVNIHVTNASAFIPPSDDRASCAIVNEVGKPLIAFFQTDSHAVPDPQNFAPRIHPLNVNVRR